MSYAQQHRNRVELHYHEVEQPPHGFYAASAAVHNGRTPVRLQDMMVDTQYQEPLPRGGSGPCLSSSSLQRSSGSGDSASDAHDIYTTCYRHLHSIIGASAAARCETTPSVSGAGVPRQAFQLLQHTPKQASPPRLKASRKRFTSPHSTVTTSETAAGQPPMRLSPPPRVLGETVDRRCRPSAPGQPDVLHDSLSTKLRGRRPLSADANRRSGDQARHAKSSSPSTGELSATRLSTSQVSASATFTARLRNIIETRQQIELLMQWQRQDEEELVYAISNIDKQSQGRSHSRQSPHPGTTFTGSVLSPWQQQQQQPDAADRPSYEQVLSERAVVLAALRQLKEKGNIIVHKLYNTVKAQQEQVLELVATVEALKKANKRLKDTLGNGGAVRGNLGSGPGAAATVGGVTRVPDTVTELQEKVITQRRVIEQMDQLMQNADRMLLAMRMRVEAAEQRASGAPAERRPPPLPLTPGRGTSNASTPRQAPVGGDGDVATVSAQQQCLLGRIAQLRQALKQEQAQRLHLEEVYGATSEETARNVALLEKRLQRVQNTRGVMYNSSGSATNPSALHMEWHTLLGEGGSGSGVSVAEEIYHKGKAQHTMLQTSSLSPSSTLARTLFTAVNVGDSTAAENYEDEKKEYAKQVPDGSKRQPSSEPAEPQNARQWRAYLGGPWSAADRINVDAAAEEQDLQLGIPVPDTSNLRDSTCRSFDSRASSASRRLVSFLPVKAADVMSCAVDSVSDREDDNDEGHVAVRRSGSNARGRAAVIFTTVPTAIRSSSSPLSDTIPSAG